MNYEEAILEARKDTFMQEVLKGLQSIDMNLALILKALQKPIKTKKKVK